MDNIEVGLRNLHDSPVFNIMKYAMCLGLVSETMRLILGITVFSKKQWSNLIWKKAWALEDQEWDWRSNFFKYTIRLDKTIGSVNYLIWWQISDKIPGLIKVCETMAKLVCSASGLKSDDYKYKRSAEYNQLCSRCEMFEVENLSHVILHCPANATIMNTLLKDLNTICPNLFEYDPDLLNIVLGKRLPFLNEEIMMEVWICAGKAICTIYYDIMRSREGIG